MAGPSLCSTRQRLDLYEGKPFAEELAQRPAILRALEEAKPAGVTCAAKSQLNRRILPLRLDTGTARDHRARRCSLADT